MPDGYQPIENYGVIGNLQTVALVWDQWVDRFPVLSLFDSPSLFAPCSMHSVVVFQPGARFPNSRPKQIYLSNSNILLHPISFPGGRSGGQRLHAGFSGVQRRKS